MDTAHYSVYKKAALPSFKGTLNTLHNSFQSYFTCCLRLDLISTPGDFERPRPGPFLLFVCAVGAVCGNDSSRSSMHLRSRNLPRPSASSPLMRIMSENNGRLIQLLAAAKPPLPAAPPVPDIEVPRNLVKLQPGQEGEGVLTEATTSGHEISPPHKRFKIWTPDSTPSTLGTNAPVTVDTLIRQIEPPFTGRVLRARISSKFKLPTQLDEVMCKAFSATLKGPARSWFRKLSPGTIDSFGDLSRLFVANFMSCRNRQKNASHLFTVHQKETESLKDFVKRFNQAILEVEDPSDKVIIMAMMEGLRPGPLFDSLSKNVPETLSALQSKADKYIAAEELAEAKRRRRGKDDHKRKEPDTSWDDYREV
ncbi:hypothetical protein Acr_03g0009900 [Actinidia rufa]|uniref:Retrotransposon gag domain-containing protein n=1 Tax=Actinidia rufa TaxID=165716 RepID=A0A7J0EDE5_9ERIC|nr:hypothetical protein Acr_03g0009900 [Actinidia rufa]